jgi:hypothetical protein
VDKHGCHRPGKPRKSGIPGKVKEYISKAEKPVKNCKFNLTLYCAFLILLNN